MSALFRKLRVWAWRCAALLAGALPSRRAPAATEAQVKAHDFRTQTRGMGLSLTNWARDRLRPRWLRLRR